MIHLDNISFWGINIPKYLKETSYKVDKQSNLTKQEQEIYDLARDNAISLLEQLLDMGNDGKSLVFYNPSSDHEEEFGIDEIAKVVSEIR